MSFANLRTDTGLTGPLDSDEIANAIVQGLTVPLQAGDLCSRTGHRYTHFTTNTSPPPDNVKMASVTSIDEDMSAVSPANISDPQSSFSIPSDLIPSLSDPDKKPSRRSPKDIRESLQFDDFTTTSALFEKGVIPRFSQTYDSTTSDMTSFEFDDDHPVLFTEKISAPMFIPQVTDSMMADEYTPDNRTTSESIKRESTYYMVPFLEAVQHDSFSTGFNPGQFWNDNRDSFRSTGFASPFSDTKRKKRFPNGEAGGAQVIDTPFMRISFCNVEVDQPRTLLDSNSVILVSGQTGKVIEDRQHKILVEFENGERRLIPWETLERG